MLYSILPNAPRPRADSNKPPPSAHADSMIGSTLNQVTNTLSQVSLQSNALANQTTLASEVLNVQKTNNKGGQKGNRREREGREQRMLPTTVAMMAERRMRGTLKRQVK